MLRGLKTKVIGSHYIAPQPGFQIIFQQHSRRTVPAFGSHRAGRYTAVMSAKPLRFGLMHLFAAMTVVAIILGLCVYVAKRYREEQIRVFQKAYLEGRVTESTAREYVGDLVDSWPAPEQPFRRGRRSGNNAPGTKN